nr:hypothetical protein B0A51_06770 [Rachicladosporium sp. CCFEE 5018]
MFPWCRLSSSHDTHLAASSAITALSKTSSEDALSNWYGVTLPIGRQQAVRLPSGRRSATTYFTVVIEDIRPTPLLSDMQSKFFVLRPNGDHSRICFPIGTVYSKPWGIFDKTAPTQYIFVKDVSNDTYWVVLDAVTGKHPWFDECPAFRISDFGSLKFGCAELRSAWPTISAWPTVTLDEITPRLNTSFRVGGVQRSSSSVLEPGPLEDDFDELTYDRLASEHDQEIRNLLETNESAAEDPLLALMQLLGLITRADARRFIKRHEIGARWFGEATAGALIHDASRLSITHATYYGLDLFQVKLSKAPEICIRIKRHRQKYCELTLTPRSGLLQGYDDEMDHTDSGPYFPRCSAPCSAMWSSAGAAPRAKPCTIPCFHRCSVHLIPPPFCEPGIPSDWLIAVTLIKRNATPRIIMPLGFLKLDKKPTRFILARDVSRDAEKYIILFNARYQHLLEGRNYSPDIIRPVRLNAYFHKGEERFTAIEVDFEGVGDDGQVTFTETGLHRQGYHVAPVALLDGKHIHPGDLPTREGQAVWLSGRWSCPPPHKAPRY